MAKKSEQTSSWMYIVSFPFANLFYHIKADTKWPKSADDICK